MKWALIHTLFHLLMLSWILHVVMLRNKCGRIKISTYCCIDLIITLVTLIISFAIKLIKRITTFQTKSPIAAQSDWQHCHRKIVKSGLKFSQKNFIRKFGMTTATRKVACSNPFRVKLSKFTD